VASQQLHDPADRMDLLRRGHRGHRIFADRFRATVMAAAGLKRTFISVQVA
jgi:hypothetical protein